MLSVQYRLINHPALQSFCMGRRGFSSWTCWYLIIQVHAQDDASTSVDFWLVFQITACSAPSRHRMKWTPDPSRTWSRVSWCSRRRRRRPWAAQPSGRNRFPPSPRFISSVSSGKINVWELCKYRGFLVCIQNSHSLFEWHQRKGRMLWISVTVEYTHVLIACTSTESAFADF